MANIYFFNPEHDLALANGSPHYQPPKNVVKFADDLSLLPLWFASNDGLFYGRNDKCFVHSSLKVDESWLSEERRLLGNCCKWGDKKLFFAENKENFLVIPWGKDHAFCHGLERFGAAPDASECDLIREVSRRDFSLKIAQHIHSKDLYGNMTPPCSYLSLDDIERRATEASPTLFKAPLSGSGRGLCWCRNGFEKRVENWAAKTLQTQGCVVAEPIWDKVADFAFEFGVSLNPEATERITIQDFGLSLFETDSAGVYRKNRLASNSDILSFLSKHVPADEIQNAFHEVKKAFVANYAKRLLSVRKRAQYFIGVDMLIGKDANGKFILNPCVEVNMRMTMGLASRVFYDKYVEEGKLGEFTIDNAREPGALLADDQRRRSEKPLIIKDGKIVSGYMSLTPVMHNTLSRARIEIF